jgi:tRNA threonylcarbamoyl adenosine modification protein (Sua5/YciO/YrdC/YwlC family)
MAKRYTIHPDNPEARSIGEVIQALRRESVLLYPTDTVYAIGCDLYAKAAVQRVRQIKQLSNDKPLTFLCASLSDAATYATIDNTAYGILRDLVPGPYTFLLPATKTVPSWVSVGRRKTVGIRIPNHGICQALLKSLGNPLISTSAHPACLEPSTPDGSVISGHLERLEAIVDCTISTRTVDYVSRSQDRWVSDWGQDDPSQNSTILNLTGSTPQVVRKGKGWEAIEDWDLADADPTLELV